jgi:hypothetical protein
MKELPKTNVLMVLLIVSLSFSVSVVSAVPAASPPTATNPQLNFVSTAYSDDHLYGVGYTSDFSIYFLDYTKNTISWKYPIGHWIGSIAISPDGRYVAVGGDEGRIYLFYQTGDLLWKKSFGNSVIRSISFSKEGYFIDASTALNQAYYINKYGDQADRPPAPAVAARPSATGSTLPKTSGQLDYLPANIDANSIFGNSYFVWIVLALLILFVFWGISSSRKKIGSARPYQPPPQNGAIYVDSIPNGAAIYFDGIYAGVSPVTISNVIPATHTIKATLNGYHPETQRINISAGQVSGFSLSLRKVTPPPPKQQPSQTPPQPPRPPVFPPKSFQGLIAQLGAKAQQDREEAQKQLIIKVNTEGKSVIQQIIKELETQPSAVKREIVNLLYYLSKESHEGQKVTEELILALTYSSPEVKWLIIQTLGRLKDKRALSALEAAVSDTDFLVKYWAIISLKSIQES